MNWVYQIEGDALRELKRLDREAQRRIVRYLDTRVAGPEDPRRFGQSLGGDLHGLWRWRVADYRIVGRVKADIVLVSVVRVGHRKDVYDF